MYKIKIQIFVSLFLVAGFFIDAQTGVTISDSIKSNNIFRKYRLYVPSSYTGQAVPLVFNLHGYTSNATQQQAYTNFMPIADTAKFIMVLPEGTNPTGPQYWNAGFGPGANDVLYMSDLIDSLDLNYNIDLNSVYSCGMSNGGIMSYYLACNLPNRFAAIASVTGSMLNGWFTCVPGRPFPVMEIHGTNDATVPYLGDATFANIDTVVKKWRKYNNCIATPSVTNVPNINTSDGATAINYKYTGGTNGAEVELYKVINGAHTWPGTFPIGTTCQDFNASVEIWRFFRKYKLNTFITSLQENIVDAAITVFPNPSNDLLHVIFSENVASEIKIITILGRELISQKASSPVNVSALPIGIYFANFYRDNTLVATKKILIAR